MASHALDSWPSDAAAEKRQDVGLRQPVDAYIFIFGSTP
jgi:hypothetical protein